MFSSRSPAPRPPEPTPPARWAASRYSAPVRSRSQRHCLYSPRESALSVCSAGAGSGRLPLPDRKRTPFRQQSPRQCPGVFVCGFPFARIVGVFLRHSASTRRWRAWGAAPEVATEERSRPLAGRRSAVRVRAKPVKTNRVSKRDKPFALRRSKNGATTQQAVCRHGTSRTKPKAVGFAWPTAVLFNPSHVTLCVGIFARSRHYCALVKLPCWGHRACFLE
jgi:hypothetical protein